MTRRCGILLIVAGLFPLVFVGLETAQASDFVLDWWTIDGGGGLFSTGGDLGLSGTVGQPDADATVMAGGSLTLTGGFWPAGAPASDFSVGDLNCDGSLNGLDIDAFVLVLTGTPPSYPQYYAAYPDCDVLLADCNADGSINGLDIDAFVSLLTGG